MNSYLLMITFRIWLLELPVAAVDYFALMKRVYEPRWGALRAHQIGMTTRLVIIAALTYVLLRHLGKLPDSRAPRGRSVLDGAVAGLEWGGSALQRRPVREILAGWHVERGYMWPDVLLAYLLMPLLFDITMHAGR